MFGKAQTEAGFEQQAPFSSPQSHLVMVQSCGASAHLHYRDHTQPVSWRVWDRLCLCGEAGRELGIETIIRSAACSGLQDRKVDVVGLLMTLVNY